MPLHEMVLGTRASVVACKAQFLLHRGCPRTAHEPQGKETKTKASPNGSSRLAFAGPWPQDMSISSALFYFDFFAAFAFAAFFLLLLIITIAKNDPTTVDASNVRMTGIRIAQTRGRKSPWSGWSSSTKGCYNQVSLRYQKFGVFVP